MCITSETIKSFIPTVATLMAGLGIGHSLSQSPMPLMDCAQFEPNNKASTFTTSITLIHSETYTQEKEPISIGVNTFMEVLNSSKLVSSVTTLRTEKSWTGISSILITHVPFWPKVGTEKHIKLPLTEFNLLSKNTSDPLPKQSRRK